MKSFIFITLILGALIFGAIVQAQVNFSPSWGKRNTGLSNGGSVPSEEYSPLTVSGENVCKTSKENIARIQRLIQMEAHNLIKCDSLTSDVRK